MIWLIILCLYIQDQYKAYNSDDVGRINLDKFPVVIILINLTIRFFIIGVRYGTTSPKVVLTLSEKPIVEQQLREALIVFGWYSLNPKDVMIEIEKAMVRTGVDRNYFTFKFLTPVYFPYLQKF